MPLPSLILWLLVFPAAALFGLVAAVATYVVARPRDTSTLPTLGLRRDLLFESWRLAALVAAVPMGILAMELALWAFFFEHRVSIVYTGMAQWAGLVLLALSPVPLVSAALGRQPLTGVPLRRAGLMLVAGLLLFPLGWAARSWDWRQLRLAALEDPAALAEVLFLKGYRFVSASEMRDALGRALPTTADVLLQVADLQGPAGPPRDREVTAYLAERLERALAAAEPAVTTEPALAAVPKLWWLTQDSGRTLRAYAMSVPELRGQALAHSPLSPSALAEDALVRGSDEVVSAVLAAAEGRLAQAPLTPGLISALSGRVDAPEPVGPIAQRLLLRDASPSALRPILPRFVAAGDPAWALVRAECPSRTPGLKALTTDSDAAVAAGAQAVLAYVRQNCYTARRVNQ